MSFIINIPLVKPLPSAANLREFWATKAKRVKSQRYMTRLAFATTRISPTWVSGFANAPASLLLLELVESHEGGEQPLQVRVRFVRVAPRKLDDDNLAHAFKAIRDEVAAMAGVDDGNSLWRWEYAQETGKPEIRIEVGG